MRIEAISEIGLDGNGRLFVRPGHSSFENIYRTGSGVSWDDANRYLLALEPREWTQRQWFERILEDVAGEYGVKLTATPDTRWTDLPEGSEAELRIAAKA